LFKYAHPNTRLTQGMSTLNGNTALRPSHTQPAYLFIVNFAHSYRQHCT